MLVQRSFIYEQRKKNHFRFLNSCIIYTYEKNCVVLLHWWILYEVRVSYQQLESIQLNRIHLFLFHVSKFSVNCLFSDIIQSNLCSKSFSIWNFIQISQIEAFCLYLDNFFDLCEKKKVDILNHFIIIIKSIFKQNQIHLALWNCHFELHTEHVFRLLSPHSPKTKPTATLSNKTCFPNQFNTFQYSVIKHISMHKISCFLETATGFTDHW